MPCRWFGAPHPSVVRRSTVVMTLAGGMVYGREGGWISCLLVVCATELSITTWLVVIRQEI